MMFIVYTPNYTWRNYVGFTGTIQETHSHILALTNEKVKTAVESCYAYAVEEPEVSPHHLADELCAKQLLL